ncbi:MAG: ABC transporter substrate-binding protein, partial [Lachnospiraceae bacterium]
MKKLSSKVIAAALAVAMVAGLTACGSSAASATGSAAGASEAAGSAESGSAGAGASGTAATGENIVNIGVTSTLSSINPLNIDVSFMALYAQSMMFLPLGALDENYAFEGLLADSVTTDDNITFTVKLADIKWSDGEPVTAQDVVWTMLKISSPEVANSSFDFSVFKGFDENGQSP